MIGIGEDFFVGSKGFVNAPGVDIEYSEYTGRTIGLFPGAADGSGDGCNRESILGVLASDIIYSCRFKGSGVAELNVSVPETTAGLCCPAMLLEQARPVA